MAEKSPKAPLTVVHPTFGPHTNDPPTGLGDRGRDLWIRIMAAYDISDEGGLALLQQCCQMVDRAEELRAAIDRDGAVVMTRSGPKDHPGLKHELAARAFVCRTISRLGLDVEPLQSRVGRPGGGGSGITWRQNDK
jgi:hypothetical protein